MIFAFLWMLQLLGELVSSLARLGQLFISMMAGKSLAMTFAGLESVAIELLFYFFETLNLRDVDILVHSDSQGAIGAFEKGRCPNWHINMVLRRIFPIIAELSIAPIFRYIQSACNPADPLSRGLLDAYPVKQRMPLSFVLPDKLSLALEYVY